MPNSKIPSEFGLSKTRRTLPIALLRAREHLMERFRPMLLSYSVTEQQWRVPLMLPKKPCQLFVTATPVMVSSVRLPAIASTDDGGYSVVFVVSLLTMSAVSAPSGTLNPSS